MTETLANRRVFRSKVDTIRPTYGFEDVSLAPGHGHGRSCRRRPRAGLLRHPTSSSPSSPRPWTPSPTSGCPPSWPASAGSRSSTSRASRPATTTPRRSSTGSSPHPTTRSRTSSPRRTRRPSARSSSRRRIDELHAAGSRVACQRHAGRRAHVRPVLRGARRGPVPRPVAGLVGPPPRRRLRAARAVRVHAVHADPGRGRQHDQRRGRVPADGAGRRGDLRRRRPGRRVHDARGAGHRRAAGHRDRGRRRGPRHVPRRDRPLRARSSRTAA